jgi:hypothetical protein
MLQFPGLSLSKSLNIKIEEMMDFNFRFEPIIVEVIPSGDRPLFDLDPDDPLNYDATAFNPRT